MIGQNLRRFHAPLPQQIKIFIPLDLQLNIETKSLMMNQALFIAAALATGPARFSIIPPAAQFVKRKSAQIFIFYFSHICPLLPIVFLIESDIIKSSRERSNKKKCYSFIISTSKLIVMES